MNNQQQIAIVAKNIDFKLVDILIERFALPFVIITPNCNEETFKNVKIINDDALLNREIFSRRCKHSRPGWLYQQFLKYEIVIKSEFDNTLIIDGDSLIKDMKFLNPNILYYTPKNIEIFYNKFISKTLGVNYVTQKNFITNQMNFNRETLASMLNTAFGSLYKYTDLIIDFLQENQDSEFSEYQTYAAWLQHEKKVRSESIKVFRRLDLLNVEPLDSLKKYDLVAFEYGHKSDLLRTIRARILYSLGKNLG
jgi:hypothetical protein